MKTETIFFKNIQKSFTFWISENEDEPFKMLDLAKSHYIWFHAEKESSCHVIVCLDKDSDIDLSKKEIQTIVKRGCFLCKFHTLKLRCIPAKTLSFIYCKIENIQRTEKAGQVITQNTKIIII